MAGSALEDKEGAEWNMNAAPLRLRPGRGDNCWWHRVTIYPGLPEAEQFPGPGDFRY